MGDPMDLASSELKITKADLKRIKERFKDKVGKKGRFIIKKSLGEGAYAKVFEGVDTKERMIVALKIYKRNDK